MEHFKKNWKSFKNMYPNILDVGQKISSICSLNLSSLDILLLEECPTLPNTDVQKLLDICLHILLISYIFNEKSTFIETLESHINALLYSWSGPYNTFMRYKSIEILYRTEPDMIKKEVQNISLQNFKRSSNILVNTFNKKDIFISPLFCKYIVSLKDILGFSKDICISFVNNECLIRIQREWLSIHINFYINDYKGMLDPIFLGEINEFLNKENKGTILKNKKFKTSIETKNIKSFYYEK